MICGFILISVSVFITIDIGLFLKRAVLGSGTVVSAVYHHGRHSGWVLRVVYQPLNSEQVEARLSGDEGPYTEGQTVAFLYDPNDFQYLRSLQVDSQYPWVEILLILIFLANHIWMGSFQNGKIN